MPNETNNPRDGLQNSQNSPGNPGGPPPGPSPARKRTTDNQDLKGDEQTGHKGGGQHQGGQNR